MPNDACCALSLVHAGIGWVHVTCRAPACCGRDGIHTAGARQPAAHARAPSRLATREIQPGTGDNERSGGATMAGCRAGGGFRHGTK